MFFIISKILGFLTHPLIWILILLFFAAFKKCVVKKKRIIVVALAMFLFFSNNFITDEVMRYWEYPLKKTNDLDSCYNIGLLLGGGMVYHEDETDRLIFRNNPDRFFQTISLYKTGRIKTIFISSGAGNLTYRDMLEANLLKRYLLEIGIPDSVIMIDSMSDNTHENALYTSKILKNTIGLKKILLITSATHMRRAIACFEKVGLSVIPYTTDKYVGKRRFELDYLFIPNVECFTKWDKIIHEMIGYLTYKLMGYI